MAGLPATSAVIGPRKSRAVYAAFLFGLRATLRSRFHGFYLCGAENAGRLDPDSAAIICSNHTNWWDGFAAAFLADKIAARSLFMVQEESVLRNYRFLRFLGVFGIDLEGSALAGIRAALRLLADPKNLVWIFPQGVLEPPSRAIIAKNGVPFLSRKSGCQILPVAFRYEWFRESRPSILASVGEPLPPGISGETIAGAIAELFRQSEPATSDPPDASWKPILPPGISINRILDLVRHRLTGCPQPFDRTN